MYWAQELPSVLAYSLADHKRNLSAVPRSSCSILGGQCGLLGCAAAGLYGRLATQLWARHGLLDPDRALAGVPAGSVATQASTAINTDSCSVLHDAAGYAWVAAHVSGAQGQAAVLVC